MTSAETLRVAKSIRVIAHVNFVIFLSLCLIHLLLGLILNTSSTLSSIHAVSVLLFGLFIVVRARKPHGVLPVLAYIAGAEVLWRMTGGNLVWEYGKYSSLVIVIFGLLKFSRQLRKKDLQFAIFSVLLLLPSTLKTVDALSFNEARQQLSFNLSGPVSLIILYLFTRMVHLHHGTYRKILRAILYPVVSIATIGLYWTLTAEHIRFSLSSNFITSGGFGPNQVSAVLGFGALVCLLLFFMEQSTLNRWLYVILFTWFTTQALLTFSRGGVFNLVVAGSFFIFQFIRQRRIRYILLGFLVISSITFSIFLFPWLNEFTGGMLERRFTEFDTTGRSQLMMSDLESWFHNPILGAGVGLSKYEHVKILGHPVSAHTEFTRLLAEHGLFGLLFITLVTYRIVSQYKKLRKLFDKGIFGAFTGWALLELSHAAMRIVAISFSFAFAFVHLVPFEPIPSNRALKNAEL